MADTDAPRRGWSPPAIPTETLAQRFRFIRLMLDEDQTGIAKRCGVNKATWRGWENGTVPQRLHEVVAQVIAAVGTDLDPATPESELRDWLMWGPTMRWITVCPGQGVLELVGAAA